jgi:hypothetical protein
MLSLLLCGRRAGQRWRMVFISNSDLCQKLSAIPVSNQSQAFFLPPLSHKGTCFIIHLWM